MGLGIQIDIFRENIKNNTYKFVYLIKKLEKNLKRYRQKFLNMTRTLNA